MYAMYASREQGGCCKKLFLWSVYVAVGVITLNILCNTIRSSCLCLLLAVDPYSVSTWIHKTECNELRLSLLRNAICIDLNMELVRIEYWQLRIQFPSFGDLRYTSDLCTSLISFRRSFSWFGIPVFRFQTTRRDHPQTAGFSLSKRWVFRMPS